MRRRRGRSGRAAVATIVALVMAASGGYGGYRLGKQTYRASALVEVAPAVPKILYDTDSNRRLPEAEYERLIEHHVALAQSERIAQLALDSLGAELPGAPKDVQSLQSGLHVSRRATFVEIAFDGIQASTRYPGGMALRFARVKGYRDDKGAAEADTVDAVRAMFEGING